MENILNNILDVKNTLLFLVLFANFMLALISYFKGKRQKINTVWTISVGTVILWILAMIFYRSAGMNSALLGAWALHISAALIPLSFLYFSFIFPEGDWTITKRTRLLIALPAIFIIFLIIYPKVLIKEMILIPGQERQTIWGPYYFLYVFYILGYFTWPLINLFQKFRKSSGLVRSQISYILLGVSLATFSGSVFNLLLPAFGYFELNWLGQVMSLFMVGFISYAIVAYKLFEIKVVLTQMLVGIMAILLFVDFIGSKSVFEYAWKGALFGMFLFFGYLLIRSVIREIERSAELEKAYKKLKKVDKAKSEFIAMASHQLRTPLTIVKGLSSMLLEDIYGKLDKKKKEPLEDIFQSNERLIDLVNDLLNISRVDLGKMELTIEEVDIAEMITDITRTLRPRAEAKGLKLEWKAPAKPLLAEVDSIKIRQIVLNIIDNAVKYTVKGKIKVIVKDLGAKVRIVIKDTGEGLTREEKEEIFESFTRGAAGLRFSIQGTGLGLYLAKKYVELHGGKIWAESDGEGKGSSFYVELSKKKNPVLMNHMSNNNGG